MKGGSTRWGLGNPYFLPDFLQSGDWGEKFSYTNVVDLGTKGRAEARDVIQGSDWQDGPKLTRYPVERWPITRDFVREIPEEEKLAKNRVKSRPFLRRATRH